MTWPVAFVVVACIFAFLCIAGFAIIAWFLYKVFTS